MSPRMANPLDRLTAAGSSACGLLMAWSLRAAFALDGPATDDRPSSEGRVRRSPDTQQVLAFVAVAGVAASAVANPLRWPVLLALTAGVSAGALRGRRDTPLVWLSAALLPVQARLAYETVAPAIAPSLDDCANLLSPLALARVAEAAVVLGTLAAAVVLLGPRSKDALSLRMPSRRTRALAIGGPLAVVPLALVIGPLLTPPFFGPIAIELGRPLAILPAVLLALANASMEELAFRGAVQGWGARSFGVNGAIVVQALLFGVTHVGSDFESGLVMLPVLAGVTMGGLAAGLIVRRTGSVLLPIAIHAALDVPLYYAFACRLSA